MNGASTPRQRRPSARRLYTAFALAAAMVLLSGCSGLTVHITSATTIGADGSGARVVTVSINEAAYAVSRLAGDPFGKARLVADAAGAHLDEFKAGGYEGVRVNKTFSSLQDLTQLSGPSKLFGPLDQISMQRTGATTSLLIDVDPPSLQFQGRHLDVSSLTDYTYEVTVPGHLTSSNADHVVGNTATWQLAQLHGPRRLTISWSQASGVAALTTGHTLPLLIGSGVLAVAILGSVAFLLGRRHGRHAPVAPILPAAQAATVCPTCGRAAKAGARFCPNDGSALVRSGQ